MRALLPILLVTAGCLAPEGDESFIVVQNLAPDGEECVFNPSPNSQFLARGTLYSESTQPYVMHPMFESRIVAPDGKESLKTITIEGAEVSVDIGPIETITGNSVSTDPKIDNVTYTSLFSAALRPNAGLSVGSIDGVTASVLSVIRSRVGSAESFSAQVQATVKAFGKYYGDNIDAEPWTFPITVCNSCVEIDLPMPCGMNTPSGFGSPCNPFQDGFIPCCTDSASGARVCPGF